METSTPPLARILRSALEPAPAEESGSLLGPYRLRQRIGEGGFSTVWLADQTEPVRREVAVKVIKRGMDTEEVIARFEAERQALALMDHPNIARVFDAGATETGRPFFVMELVRGTPLTHYCDAHRLPVAARLRLFITVCQGVQHAHQKGVIHRDLKPSNILVASCDGVPQPKIIDFGIAKAAGPRLTERALVTQLHDFLGTPAYTSPEQIATGAADVDTRADIYSLGVILHELLCGQLPFGADRPAQTGIEGLRRLILEADPVRPSLRYARLPEAERTDLARKRGLDPRRLAPLLRGDLDWIVLHCLEKDRQRRYDTAAGLAADLERYLAHEPVAARPPSTLYRLGKSVRRHRLAYAAAAALALTLLLGGVVSAGQALRATRAEREQSRLRAAESALRRRAEAQALAMRRLAYASDLNLAQQALAEDNLGRTQELLDRHRPGPGEEDLRGWEWRYLWQFCRSHSSANLNDRPVRAKHLAVSSDGRWVAAARLEGAGVELWDLRTREHSTLPLPASGALAAAVAFSPATPLLAVALVESFPSPATPPTARLLLWDPEARRTVRGWSLPFAPYEEIGRLEFSADGRRLLVESGGSPGVWSVSDGTLLQRLQNPTHGRMALTPDFRLAALAGAEGAKIIIHLVELETGRVLHQLQPEAGEYLDALAFSPDGRLLASSSGSSDPLIRLWDTDTGRPAGALSGHRGPSQRLLFRPDGLTLVSASVDQTIRVWDVPGRKLLRTLRGHQEPVLDLALLPGGPRLVSAGHDGTIRLWDAEQAPPPAAYTRLADKVMNWNFSHDGRSLISLDGRGGLRRWSGPNFSEREILADFGLVGWGWPLHGCLNLDPPLAAVFKQDGRIQVWDWRTSRLERELQTTTGRTELVSCAALLDGGRTLLANWMVPDQPERGLRELDLATGRTLRSWAYDGPASFFGSWYVPACLVSPDGRWCLISWTGNPWSLRSDDRGPVELLDRRDGTVRRLPGAVFWWWNSASFSADGRLLAVPSSAGTTVWELQPLRLVRTFPQASLCAAFTPDGRRLVLDRGLWDTASWQQVLRLDPTYSLVFDAAFSPDGNVFGARTQFGDLHLWHAPSWEEIAAAEKGGRDL